MRPAASSLLPTSSAQGVYSWNTFIPVPAPGTDPGAGAVEVGPVSARQRLTVWV